MSDSSGSRRTQSTRPTSKTGSGTSGKRSSAYDDNFEQHLIDYNIYPEEYDYPNDRQTPEPNDLEGFHRRLQLPRPSLSPSRFPDSSFRSFKRKNGRVIDEGEVMRDVVPIICGNANVPNKQNLLFTKLNPIANNTIVDAKPDFYDGARLEDIDKQVRRDLGPFIIPTGHRTAPVAPNFFLEAKAPKGGSDVSKRQACYNGALGARAMHKLQSYKQDEPVYDGNPYTITSTYHAGTGTLQMYTTHLTQSTDGTPEYHTTQVRSLALTDTPDGFRQGATVFRDARDWAKEQRDAIILAANERIESADAAPPPFESFEHIDGLDPTGVQDVSHLTQAEDTVYGPRYYKPPQDGHGGFKNDVELQGAANRGTGYLHTDPSTSGSSDYNGSSDTTVPQLVEESQTSIDELALGTYTQPKASNKRRNRPSEKTASKAPRKTDSRSRRRGSRR